MEASERCFFTFSNEPIKSEKLKNLLINVIKMWQESGLEVVSTVCDQGAANQAVINLQHIFIIYL